MAAPDISWKIIYLCLLAGSHKYYVEYTYPLQICRHLTFKLFIQGHPQSAKVPHEADFKSAYISCIIGATGLACETNQ